MTPKERAAVALGHLDTGCGCCQKSDADAENAEVIELAIVAAVDAERKTLLAEIDRLRALADRRLDDWREAREAFLVENAEGDEKAYAPSLESLRQEYEARKREGR